MKRKKVIFISLTVLAVVVILLFVARLVVLNFLTKTLISTAEDIVIPQIENYEDIIPEEQVKEQPNVKTESVSDGGVVYSDSVYISYDTLVKHPKSGELVKIGPYAERFGVTNFLEKPISCVIKKSGEGYILTASCNGMPLIKYPLKNEAKLKWAIGVINSYS